MQPARTFPCQTCELCRPASPCAAWHGCFPSHRYLTITGLSSVKIGSWDTVDNSMHYQHIDTASMMDNGLRARTIQCDSYTGNSIVSQEMVSATRVWSQGQTTAFIKLNIEYRTRAALWVITMVERQGVTYGTASKRLGSTLTGEVTVQIKLDNAVDRWAPTLRCLYF